MVLITYYYVHGLWGLYVHYYGNRQTGLYSHFNGLEQEPLQSLPQTLPVAIYGPPYQIFKMAG
jgi:hypothetical protein